MDNWMLALLIKPFVALVVFGLIALPIRLLVQNRLKDSRLKRLLLWELPK